jgi:hypothetical protein
LEVCEESRGWTEQRAFVLWEKKPLFCRLRPAAAAPAAPGWGGGGVGGVVVDWGEELPVVFGGV